MKSVGTRNFERQAIELAQTRRDRMRSQESILERLVVIEHALADALDRLDKIDGGGEPPAAA